jgi:hypothetical protein
VLGTLSPGLSEHTPPYSAGVKNGGTIPLLSTCIQNSGFRFRGLGFDSSLYHIFWEAVDLKRGPLCLVKINEELCE